MVDVEELAEAREGTFLGGARVGWVVACCADAGGVVGDYVAGGVFAHEAGGVLGWVVGVGLGCVSG